MTDNDETAKRGVRSKVLRKGSSGGHPIMQAVRKKLDSIREGTLSDLEALNRRIDKLKEKSDPPSDKENEPPEEGEHIPVAEPERDRP